MPHSYGNLELLSVGFEGATDVTDNTDRGGDKNASSVLSVTSVASFF